MPDTYSEPTKDIVVVIILLVSACILLGIGLGGLYYSTSAVLEQPAKTK